MLSPCMTSNCCPASGPVRIRTVTAAGGGLSHPRRHRRQELPTYPIADRTRQRLPLSKVPAPLRPVRAASVPAGWTCWLRARQSSCKITGVAARSHIVRLAGRIVQCKLQVHSRPFSDAGLTAVHNRRRRVSRLRVAAANSRTCVQYAVAASGAGGCARNTGRPRRPRANSIRAGRAAQPAHAGLRRPTAAVRSRSEGRVVPAIRW